MKHKEVKWILKGASEASDGFQKSLPSILVQLLMQRGVKNKGEAEYFLRPRLQHLSDPFEIPNMRPAVERILQAVDQAERVLVYGDYDVDGVTSVTLMLKVLAAYGVQAEYFIPKRGEEGYGLSELAIERMTEEFGSIDLVITVDCGTASIAEVAILNDQGVDVVVVDHHEMSDEGCPECVAIVNPKLGDDFQYLCAAGVVFKLAHALMKTRKLETFDLRECLDLVAVATISDIVPLVDENRILVRHGLGRLLETKNKGLEALQKVANIKGRVTSMDVGFRVGPRLNAAGRMDQPDEALKLLMAETDGGAMELSQRLDDFNVKRQRLEQQIQEEAMSMLRERFDPDNDPVIVLASRDWHPGVVGIVASKLMRFFYKPTFVIAIDSRGIGKGSGRSIEGVNLVEGIRDSGDLLLSGGGHEMAAGLSIEENQLDAFREKFGSYVLGNTSEAQRMARIHVDAEISFDQLSLEFLDSYELLQPFGSKNPQPVFMSRNVWLTEVPMRLKNKHLKLFMKQGSVERDAIFFGAGDRDLPAPPWDVAFTIDRNTFRGQTSLQIVIQNVRAMQVD